MSAIEDNKVWWGDVHVPDRRCTATNAAGERCGCVSVRCPRRERPWPGVTDRCFHHVDELARRTRDLDRIAERSGADPVESLEPPERKKQIRPARKRTPPAVKRSEPPPTEHTCQHDRDEEPTWDDVLAILEDWQQGRGSCPEGWPPGYGDDDTDHQAGQRQLMFPFAASLSQRLEEPPRLEPGPKATKSNAVVPHKEAS